MMRWVHWIRLWIISRRSSNNSLLPNHYIEINVTRQLFNQLTRIEQEQSKLSKELLLMDHRLETALDTMRDLFKKISSVDMKSSCLSQETPQLSDELMSNSQANDTTCSNCYRKTRPMDSYTLDEMELYRPGSDFYMISNSYKIQLPDTAWKRKCKLAILISSGPNSGSEIIAEIVHSLLGIIDVSFRGSAFWNFHAHSNMKMDQALLWLNKFHTWLHSLRRGDIVVLRTPFYQEDGNAARQVCQNFFIINSLQSLENMALLHRFSAIDHLGNQIDPVDDKNTLDILRQMLSHQRRWKEDSNLTISVKGLQNIRYVAEILCQELIRTILGFTNICNDTTPMNKLQVGNESIQESYQHLLGEEDRLRKIQNEVVDQETMKAFLNQVQSNFYQWIVTESPI